MFKTSTFEKEAQSADLDGLNEKSKRVMELRYMEEKSFDEIAAIINSSSSNVRQIISRSLKFLRKNKEGSV
jgi:RNA polymerase sigma-70 factor (ECF subfamily)